VSDAPPSPAAGIWLARHGQTPYNRERRFQGQTSVPLDETGRGQAEQLARNAQGRGFVALWCSPLRRARETADVVGAALGLEPREDARLMETDTGDWTDRLFDDVEREQPQLYAAYHRTDPDFAFPGGESLEDQLERVVAAVVDITQGGELPALVVCHRGVIRCLRSHTDRAGLKTFMSWDVPNGALEPL
jgi:broad specificity phosphatase PhoE